MTTPMDTAHQAMLDRLHRLDELEEFRERNIVSELVDVVDYAKRITDNATSTHYRAEKSGNLVDAAMSVRRVALEHHAVAPSNFDVLPERERKVLDRIYELSALARSLDAAVERVLWATVQRRPLYRDQLGPMRAALGELDELLADVAADAIDYEP